MVGPRGPTIFTLQGQVNNQLLVVALALSQAKVLTAPTPDHFLRKASGSRRRHRAFVDRG